MNRYKVAPSEKLDDAFLDELVRKLVRDAIDAVDEFMGGEPDFNGRVLSELTAVMDSRDAHVTIEVDHLDGDGGADAESFPLGTTKARMLRWLREFASFVASESDGE
ncbi:hypothetical protein [Planctomyces sp. SH-PL62]|uniref:hypothetical protein n=1 Tax=Planctomyces sp. SH-PL62 TaxID=1636152 RepID=UPI00078CF446|nr:hypothetical protein [Planctomyces sp. SH-PL62]AMV41048.1 hypothetical protein VT85_26670 [Planctomyces sp. SH-PL62]